MFGHWHDLENIKEITNVHFTWDWDFGIALGVLVMLFIGFIYHWKELNHVTKTEDDREEKRKKMAEKH